MEKLEELAEKHPDRVRLLKKANVVELVKNGQGECIGIKYHSATDGQVLEEHGVVVLATGGYAADFTADSLLKTYRPELWDLPTTNGDHSTGDGIKLAMGIGSSTVDLEKVQVGLIICHSHAHTLTL